MQSGPSIGLKTVGPIIGLPLGPTIGLPLGPTIGLIIRANGSRADDYGLHTHTHLVRLDNRNQDIFF